MQKKNLNARHKLILTYMNGKHSIVPGRELAERLNVSTRTVRFAVSEINEILKGEKISIESVSGKGYRLRVEDRALMHQLISDRDIIHTKEDRIVYLIMRFISGGDWVNLDELEDDMFVSRTTLENDIREIKRRICDHEPHIMMKRKNNSILFEDDEMKKRNILLHLYRENWDFDSREGISFRNGLIDGEILEELTNELRSALEAYGIGLDDHGFVTMKIALAIIYIRNIEEHRLYNAGAFGRYGSSYNAVKRILDSLGKKWDLELEEADYAWLTGCLDLVRVFAPGNRSYESLSARFGEGCVRIAEQLTHELYEMYAMEFPGDDIFRKELLVSTKAFMNQQLPTQVQNRFSTDLLEKNYALLGDVSRYLSGRMEELCGHPLREGEENWLLPMLASATERKERAGRDRIRVVVVSHYNESMTQYLCDDLYKLFGARFVIVGAVPVYDRKKALLLNPSLVIATAKMKLFEDRGIPCIVTSPIIAQDEMIEIDRVLQRVERTVLHDEIQKPIGVYLEKGGRIDISRKCGLEEILGIAELRWRTDMLFPRDNVLDIKAFRYSILDEETLFAYQSGDITLESFVTEIRLGHSIVFRRSKNIRRIYAGLISRDDRRYIPAIYGALDIRKEKES